MLVVEWMGGRRGGRNRNAPDAKEEHEPAHHLPLPRQTQPHELRERQGEHPNVKDDARRGRHPGEDVVVPAVAVVQALPLRPEVGERLALEDDGEEEGEVVDEVEHHGADQETAEALVLLGREDAYVEEEDGGAAEESAGGVDKHVAEEDLEERERCICPCSVELTLMTEVTSSNGTNHISLP